MSESEKTSDRVCLKIKASGPCLVSGLLPNLALSVSVTLSNCKTTRGASMMPGRALRGPGAWPSPAASSWGDRSWRAPHPQRARSRFAREEMRVSWRGGRPGRELAVMFTGPLQAQLGKAETVSSPGPGPKGAS